MTGGRELRRAQVVPRDTRTQALGLHGTALENSTSTILVPVDK